MESYHDGHQAASAAPTKVRTAALAGYAAGLSIVPIKEDGSKRPDGPWKEQQTNRLPLDQIKLLFGNGRTGVGAIMGQVSGGVEREDGEVVGGTEMFEAETERDYIRLKLAAQALGLGEVIDRIEAGCSERTPGGGIHLYCRCAEIAGNTKLAERPDPAVKNGRKPIFETRGEGGFVVMAPSHGQVHPTGKPYERLRGGFDTIVTITPAERKAIWDVARSLDEMPVAEPTSAVNNRMKAPAKGGKSDGWLVRPGDDYNQRTTWDDVLPGRGFHKVHTSGGVGYWRRPGKTEGWSATTNHADSDLLYVFSTSTALEAERSYDRFGVVVALDFAGDFAAATKALHEQGYGEKAPETDKKAKARPKAQQAPPGPPPALGDGDGPEPPINRTDLGNSRRLVKLFGAKIRYCYVWGVWLVWDGKRWKEDRTGAIYRLAKKAARSIAAEITDDLDDAEAKALLKWALESESKKRLDAMIALAQSEPGIPVEPHQLDADPWLLNVANGTLDLRSGQLRDHESSDLLTKLSLVAFDPKAEAPQWLKFLGRAMEADAGRIAYLQRASGYGMTADISEHVLFFLYGTGRNGKGTYLETLLYILGDYATTIDPALITLRMHDDHPTGLTDLDGRRFVPTVEVDDGKRLAESLVKRLTGGDRIKARRMRENFYEFNPTHKFFLAANHKPTIRGTDEGIWSRIKLIPFNVFIPPTERDRRLPQKLRAEASGILNWLVEGCLAWQRDGLNEPAAVAEATSAYRAEMDAVGRFVDECCVVNKEFRVKAQTLYQKYTEWCKESGERETLTKTAFGTELNKRGYEQKKSNSIVWRHGLSLAEAPSEDQNASATPF
jgi:P4 family phage/plasmid primase-like protien